MWSWKEFKELDSIVHATLFLLLMIIVFGIGVDFGKAQEQKKQYHELQQKMLIIDAVKEAMRK